MTTKESKTAGLPGSTKRRKGPSKTAPGSAYSGKRASAGRAKRAHEQRSDAGALIGHKRDGEKRADEQLAELTNLYQTAPVGLCLLDRDLRFVRINERLAAMNGKPVEEHIGQTLREVIPAVAKTQERIYRRVIETGEPALDFEVSTSTEAWRGTALVSYYPVRFEDGTVLAVNTVVQDITERRQVEQALQEALEELELCVQQRTKELEEINAALKAEIDERREAEKALRESEERFRQLSENIREVIWLVDWRSDNILYISPAYERIFGRPTQDSYQGLGAWIAHVHPDDRQRAETAFSAGAATEKFDIEYRIVRPDGSIRWLHDRGFPVYDEKGEVYRIAGAAQDITERKRAEEERVALEAQLFETQKRESLGVLAGGIAHDFNNILTAILGYGLLVYDELPAGSDEQSNQEQVIKASKRAAELVRQLLTYSRQEEREPRPTDLATFRCKKGRFGVLGGAPAGRATESYRGLRGFPGSAPQLAAACRFNPRPLPKPDPCSSDCPRSLPVQPIVRSPAARDTHCGSNHGGASKH